MCPAVLGFVAGMLLGRAMNREKIASCQELHQQERASYFFIGEVCQELARTLEAAYRPEFNSVYDIPPSDPPMDGWFIWAVERVAKRRRHILERRAEELRGD